MKPWLSKLIRRPVFRFFASLKLAVFVLLALSAVLAVATVLESTYGTRAVKVLVYGTWWFYGLLAFLGANVFCAALSRYPWKKHQIGFLITHGGILLILAGSYVTMHWGVDGNLPVEEGTADGRVILTDLRLSVFDEDNRQTRTYPVAESAFAKKGELVSVAFPEGLRLVATEFLPRVTFQKSFLPSPLEGVGAPAVRVEIFNSRFQVDEWLVDTHPGKGNELSLGPAVLRFRKLWTAAEERDFLASPKASSGGPQGIGTIIFDFKGRSYRHSVESLRRGWVKLGEGLEAKVVKYLPYAIVEKGDLVSKSNDPVNPAVQVLLRDGSGAEEKHSVFAVFPEFTTMHRNHRKDSGSFGVKLRMVSHGAKKGDAGERGRLELAQAHDDQKLYYRVYSKAGEVNASGEVQVGQETVTGWMDLRFVVREWIPHSVPHTAPRYVEKIAGTDNNFLSSLKVQVIGGKELASEGGRGVWLTEGGSEIVSLGGRKLVVSLQRESLSLPFEIFLHKFHIGNDPGSTRAASYESNVEVRDGKAEKQGEVLISMNEPLKYGGYTFYQASYSLREGQPPISVFSVNFDPGRWIKYLGSLVLCLGIAIMFWMNPHYWEILLGSPRKES